MASASCGERVGEAGMERLGTAGRVRSRERARAAL